MSSKSSSAKSGGITMMGALFLVFLTLKLTGYIGWSWWWITAPLWVPTGILVGVLTFILLLRILFIILK